MVRNLELHVREKYRVKKNLQTDIDALHVSNVAGG
jgi:hypothetical protein